MVEALIPIIKGLYIIGAFMVWMLSTFCTAIGFMGYQFEKWYHWSSWILFAVMFVQPVGWIVLYRVLFN